MMLYASFALILTAALAFLLAPIWRALNVKHRLAAILFFAIGSFGLYALTGTPGIVPLLAARDERLSEVKQLITTNAAIVKTDPKNTAAWLTLGQSFMESGQFSAAANAFKQSVILTGGNPALLIAYAQALTDDANGTVTDDALKALQIALLQQPENPDARYLLAVRHLQDGHPQVAMREMKELYHSLPADSPLKAMIDHQIGRKP